MPDGTGRTAREELGLTFPEELPKCTPQALQLCSDAVGEG